MTAVRKRNQLTGMRYDRVDLVPEGANAHARVLITKNKQPRVVTVRKAMGSVKCNHCGKMNGQGASVCRYCHSTDLAKTRIDVVKTTVNPKKQPKNDDATNPGDYTFEDEQYDQDNGENGEALGTSVERSVMNKGWFAVPVRKDDIEDVDNTVHEKEKEGEDSDDDIEALAEKTPSGLSPDKRKGYIDTATGANDTTGMTFKARGGRVRARKEKPGRNSYDYGDQGSQEISESAEQMYRAENHMTPQAKDRRESTMSDVFAKARRRKTNREGLDILENGNSGIYQRPGVKRNGTNTGHNKTTNRGRTAVAPPKNPMDVGKSFRVVRKTKVDTALPVLEALNLGVKLAENVGLIMKSGRTDLYETVVGDFLETLNASAGEWFAGSTVTKSKSADKQASDVADRVNEILRKASPQAEMSDEASEGEDEDSVDSSRPSVSAGKAKNAGGDETGVGKGLKKVTDEGDIYKGLHPDVVAKLRRLEEVEELRTQESFLKKARELRHLPGFNEEKIAKQLRFVYDGQGEEAGDEFFQTLSASANALADGAVYKQLGLPGGGSSEGNNDPMAQADAWARSQISKSADGTTIEQLRVQYMHEHGADFYAPAKSA